MTNETQIVGRCIGCMHDFSVAPVCGGCGAVDYPARQPAPMSDEDLTKMFVKAMQEEWRESSPPGGTSIPSASNPCTIAGIRAVRDAILAAQAVQVPDLEYLVASALDDARCVLTRAYAANDPEMREVAKVAIRAIEQAKGEP